jgi:RNA polymerase sigma-70 factor (ECF subfamily)
LLFKQYSGKVYSFALKLTKDQELAEEVVQEIFLKIWLDRHKLTEINEFGAYLNRINRNHCLNVIRQLANQQKTASGYGMELTEYSHDTE